MSQAPGRVVTPLEGVPFAGWDATKPIEAPLALHACAVKPEWTDYNGHMSESAYLLAFGNSSDAFFRFIGIDEAYRASGFSLYTIDTRIRNLAELGVGRSAPPHSAAHRSRRQAPAYFSSHDARRHRRPKSRSPSRCSPMSIRARAARRLSRSSSTTGWRRSAPRIPV